jgi:hypothetical protein
MSPERHDCQEDTMAPMNELERFRGVWDMEAQLTTKLLESLPTNQYDFRPDPQAAPSARWRGT